VLIRGDHLLHQYLEPRRLARSRLLARRRRARPDGQAHIKTSLAPGSRVVTEYLGKAGLLPYSKNWASTSPRMLHTCIGIPGRSRSRSRRHRKNDMVVRRGALGNRNFEARIHPNIPPTSSPRRRWWWRMRLPAPCWWTSRLTLGKGTAGKTCTSATSGPTQEEIAALMKLAMDPATFRASTRTWARPIRCGRRSPRPPGRCTAGRSRPTSRAAVLSRFLDGARTARRHLGGQDPRIFGDSVTTDHISRPARSAHLPGRHLPAGARRGVADFNSYGARRGNHEGDDARTFANVRIKNLMRGHRGGSDLYKTRSSNLRTPRCRYIADGTPTVVFGGEEYGTGSSVTGRRRARSSWRQGGDRAQLRAHPPLHLVGMGVLPLQFTAPTRRSLSA